MTARRLNKQLFSRAGKGPAVAGSMTEDLEGKSWLPLGPEGDRSKHEIRHPATNTLMTGYADDPDIRILRRVSTLNALG